MDFSRVFYLSGTILEFLKAILIFWKFWKYINNFKWILAPNFENTSKFIHGSFGNLVNRTDKNILERSFRWPVWAHVLVKWAKVLSLVDDSGCSWEMQRSREESSFDGFIQCCEPSWRLINWLLRLHLCTIQWSRSIQG